MEQWLELKTKVMADIKALLSLGVPLETARRLANWNPTYEVDSFEELTPAFHEANPGAEQPPSLHRAPADMLWVSLSENRWSPTPLHEAVLDSGKQYAVFIVDAPEAGLIQIGFYLDSAIHHTEFSDPWDYNGTLGGGEASKVSFSAGVHTINAEITDSFGNWEVNATFEVQ